MSIGFKTQKENELEGNWFYIFFCLGKVNFLIKKKVIRNISNPSLKNN